MSMSSDETKETNKYSAKNSGEKRKKAGKQGYN